MTTNSALWQADPNKAALREIAQALALPEDAPPLDVLNAVLLLVADENIRLAEDMERAGLMALLPVPGGTLPRMLPEVLEHLRDMPIRLSQVDTPVMHFYAQPRFHQ